MKRSTRCWLALGLAVLLAPVAAAASEPGRIEGRVTAPDGTGLGGVRAVLEETGSAQITDEDGRFAFAGLAPGSYSLTLELGEDRLSVPPVEVTPGATVRVDRQVDWTVGFAETVTVFSAARRRQRIVEAPAAVTIVPAQEAAREAASGQLPELLEFSLGTELTQGGVYEFNLNTRGVNDPFNRRLLTLIDGRDASLPSLGSQEWAAIPFPLDDLASVELVRGPVSALYGADAFNGVLNLVTKAPRTSQGGTLRLTAGELSTRRIDLRYAGRLAEGWYGKLVAGYGRNREFTRARTRTVEYSRPCTFQGEVGCLPLEAVPPPLEEDRILSGLVRIDRDFGGATTLVMEAGTARFEGPLGVTEFGRLQLTDVDRPWARVNLTTPHWNLLGSYTGRRGDGQLFLSIDYPFWAESDRLAFEVQGNTPFARGRGFLVGGASVMQETVDSADPQGRQTVTFERQEEDFEALFGQVEYNFTSRLKGVLAARWDRTSLHASQLSPRGSLVYALRPNQTLRASAGRAFLTPSYVQLFLYLPVAEPVDLSPFEAICAAGGVECGFGRPVRVLAVGDPEAEVEEIRSFELGYAAHLGDRFYLTADYFDNRIESFISDFIPYLNPGFGGRLHGAYPAYQPPAELAPPLAALLLANLQANLPPELFALLSTGAEGEPIFPLISVVNFGRVDTQGLEVGLTGSFSRRWSGEAGYTYFDFDVKESLPEDPALPNAPEHRFHLGLTYLGERLDGALRYRHVDAFEWSAGLFRGRVPAYGVVDLTSNVRLGDHWTVGVDVSNLLDEEHYEFFGGDLLGRRALAHVTWRM